MTTAEFKRLVGDAEIEPDTPLRLEKDGKWMRASRVKGLGLTPEERQAKKPAEQRWYIQHGGKIVGPVTSAQLKQLVSTGKIQPATKLRLGDNGQWKEASGIKGLSFPSSAEQPKQVNESPLDSEQFRTESVAADQPTENVPINPYESPAFSEDERPVTRVMADTAALKPTRIGLFTVYYGIVAVLAGIVGGMLFGILGAVSEIDFTIVVGILGLFAGIGGYIAILIGQIMCIMVPRETGGKRYAQIALAMQVIPILITIFNSVILPLIVVSSDVDPTVLVIGSGFLGLTSPIITFAGYICFLLFLKHLAMYLHRPDLHASSSKVMVRVIGTGVMTFLLLVAFMALPFFGIGMAGPMMIAALILSVFLAVTFIFTFVTYANLVGYMARAIVVGDEAVPAQVKR
jgi:hypothetical protein